MSLANNRQIKGGDAMLDQIYLEIKAKWNELRLAGADPDVLKFLVHLMSEIESEGGSNHVLIATNCN